MFSLILLNYNRPANIVKIVDKMKHYNFIDEIIVSNGNEKMCVTIHDKKVKVFQDYGYINDIYSLDRRFISGMRAKNENLIIMDDDLIIEKEELAKLIKEYTKDTERLVGPFCRNFNQKTGYKQGDVYDEVDIVLTRLLLCQKKMCSLFFLCKPLVEPIYKTGIPYGNGEDICFSFFTSLYYRKNHYCFPIKVIELNDEHGLSKKKTHLAYRQKLCHYLIDNSDSFQEFISHLTV